MEPNISKGKCPACDSGVVALTKQDGRVILMVKCKCSDHPDDIICFDLETLIEGLNGPDEKLVYIHKGNSTLH